MKIFEKLIRRASHKALGDFTEDENYLFLRKNYLFKELSAEAFLFIMTRLVERRYSNDELIFKQDNLGICLFVLKKGQVEIYIRTGEDEKVIYGHVEEGALFGEMSLVSSVYRTATAKATESDTVLLTLSTFDIEALSKQFPNDGLRVLKGITDTIAENLVKTTKNFKAAKQEIKALKEKLAEHERG